MKESLVKYLAGLLDADGSLSFNFKRDSNREGLFFVGLQMKLSGSDAVDKHGFIESLPWETEMGKTSREGSNKQFVNWIVTKRADLEMLLPRIIKHMVIKAQHWNWMLLMWRQLRKESKTVTAQQRAALTQASKDSRKTQVGPLKPKNHLSWAWVAGYLDGDGCYSYRSGKYKSYKGREYKQWTIKIEAIAHVTDLPGLEMLQKCFGGKITTMNKSENVRVWSRSLGYQSRSFALSFLPKVAKHARLKRHKIDRMIHHHRQRLSVPGPKGQAIV